VLGRYGRKAVEWLIASVEEARTGWHCRLAELQSKHGRIRDLSYANSGQRLKEQSAVSQEV